MRITHAEAPELDELDQIGIELLGVFEVEMLDIALVTEILVVLRICGHVLRKPVDLQDPEFRASRTRQVQMEFV